MKVDITLRDSGGGWFAPGDEICGMVYIATRETDTMPAASIYLCGKLRLSFWPPAGDSARPHFPEGGALSMTKTLLEVAKVVVPDPPSEGPQSSTKGQCVIPFGIPIPARVDLPPTVNMALPGLKVRVDYSVRLEVTRPGLLRKKITREKTVLLWVAGLACGMTPVSTGTAATAMLPAEKLDPRGQAPYQEPYLPQYSPSIQVNLAVPAPPVVHIGHPLSMEITASLPEDLSNRLGVVGPRSLYIVLRAITTVRIGSVNRATASRVEICSVQRDLDISPPAGDGLYSFDNAMWQDKLVPPIPPTFRSAHISRSYVLEVTAGFSCEALERVEHVVLCMDITVAPPPAFGSPPPKYSAMDSYGCRAQSIL